MEESLATVRAGFLLVCGMFALAWPREGSGPARCAWPVLMAEAEIVCAPTSAGVPRLSGPSRRLFGQRIDPNRDDRLALETLPGIGPARASAILEERARAPFSDIRDLERVRGLGPARVAAVTPFLRIEGPLAALNESPVKSPSCRSCCGSARGDHPAASPSRCEEER